MSANLDNLSDEAARGMNRLGVKPERGHIALVGCANRGRVVFRNIRIKDSNAGEAERPPASRSASKDGKAGGSRYS
jgi:hypothetical protein